MNWIEREEAFEGWFLGNLPNIREHEDPAVAAKELYEFLRTASENYGQNPDIEVGIFKPGERVDTAGNNWWVLWESGPHDWAIRYQLDGKNRTYARDWYCETYWGFDCIFYPT